MKSPADSDAEGSTRSSDRTCVGLNSGDLDAIDNKIQNPTDHQKNDIPA